MRRRTPAELAPLQAPLKGALEALDAGGETPVRCPDSWRLREPTPAAGGCVAAIAAVMRRRSGWRRCVGGGC